MQKFSGKGVYSAVAIGTVSVFERRGLKVGRVEVSDAEAEIDRFEKAKKKAIKQSRLLMVKRV